MRKPFDIDHTDPKWKEGRDYQIVCGLNVETNLRVRSRGLNSKKGNRFLPWRNSSDEIGGDPVEQGDLCLFLDPDTNEWVLEEFLGEWWFEKSKFTGSQGNRVVTDEFREKMKVITRGRALSEETKEKLTGLKHSDETKEKIRRTLTGTKQSEESKQKKSVATRLHYARKRGQKELRQMAINDPLMPDFDDL